MITLIQDYGTFKRTCQSNDKQDMKQWFNELSNLCTRKRSMRGLTIVINYGYFRKQK